LHCIKVQSHAKKSAKIIPIIADHTVKEKEAIMELELKKGTQSLEAKNCVPAYFPNAVPTFFELRVQKSG
jgi:hypothetical protein